MYRKISIEANEYTKIDRWAKIKSKSEEIARVAQIALNLDTSTEEARLVEEIVLNLLREIRILREEQRETRYSTSPPAASTSSTFPATSSSTSTFSSSTSSTFRGSGGSGGGGSDSNSSSSDTPAPVDEFDDLPPPSSSSRYDKDSSSRYDKDNPPFTSTTIAHSVPLSVSKLNSQNSAPNSPPIPILSEHYNPQYMSTYQPPAYNLPYLSQEHPVSLPITSPLQPHGHLQVSQFSLSTPAGHFSTTSTHTPLSKSPPLPPSQLLEATNLSESAKSSSLSPPSLPQPHKQKKRKSEKKPP